ncbi:MAG: SurA N-terminal domain-containing protein [Chitinophagales bacterium]|nr:SurA N-terminal domain-containing protein [Hyphomicrobiales bacterium]
MLDSLRKGAGSWAAKILLVLLAASFLVWGIADYAGLGRQSMASVGGRDISTQEFERAYQNQVRAMSNRIGRQITSDEVRALNLQDQVLRQLIGGLALDQHAARLRLGVTDEVVAEGIRREQGFQDLSGNFSRARFDDVLRDNNLTESAYVADERRQSVRGQLLETITTPAQAPQVLIDAVNRYQNETRVIKFFALPESSAGEIAQPDAGQVSAYYDANKAKFTLPEYRKFTTLSVTPATLAGKIEISEDDLKAAFEEKKDSFGTPEKRKVEQIAFTDMASAQTARDKLIQPGSDFAEIAKEPGFTGTYFDFGLTTKNDLSDKKVADAAFALNKSEISQPVEGDLSFVVARVTDIVPGFSKSYDDVKTELREAIALDRAGAEVTKLVNSIEDRRAGGAKLAEIAKDLGMTIQDVTSSVDGRTPGGETAEVPAGAKNLLREVFATEVGAEGPALEVDGGGTAWYDVVEIIPQRLKTLDEVKDEAARQWRSAELQSRLATKAREVIKTAALGSDIAALATPLSAPVKTSQPIKRTGAEPGLPISAVAVAFGLEKGALETIATATGGQVILQVEAIKSPPPFDDKQIMEAKKELEQSLSNDYAAQYITAIQTEFGVAINKNALASLNGQQ